jgi:hypothetical protein
MCTKVKEADGVGDQKLVLQSKGDQLKGHARHATLWAKRQGVGTDQKHWHRVCRADERGLTSCHWFGIRNGAEYLMGCSAWVFQSTINNTTSSQPPPEHEIN